MCEKCDAVADWIAGMRRALHDYPSGNFLERKARREHELAIRRAVCDMDRLPWFLHGGGLPEVPGRKKKPDWLQGILEL